MKVNNLAGTALALPQPVVEAVEMIPQDLIDAAIEFGKSLPRDYRVQLWFDGEDGIRIAIEDRAVEVDGAVSREGEFMPITARPRPWF